MTGSEEERDKWRDRLMKRKNVYMNTFNYQRF